ncbi:MAG: TFIIB-type zinc ribbon-containing protein [Eubacteriales bacterium]|nr:TFIIB-type zinc ribbon-containing protein [Eubacteriales bacterium]
MAVLTYKCPNCNGPLTWNGQKEKFVCDYCMSSFTEAELEALAPSETKAEEVDAEMGEAIKESAGENGASAQAFNEKPAAGTAAAQGAGAASGEDAGTAKPAKMKLYSCPSCGAQVVTDDTTAATTCYYCHNPIVMMDKLGDDYTPDFVIPFAIDKKKATEIFTGWVKQQKYVPKDFYNAQQIELLSGVYFPYWVYSCDLKSDVKGTAEHVRTWDEMGMRNTETSVYDISDSGSMDINNLSRIALNKASKVLCESVMPFELDKLKKFQPGYLQGFIAETRDIQKAEIQPDIRKEVEEFAAQSVNAKISEGGFSKVNIASLDTRISNEKYQYALMPIWTVTYKDKGGKVYYFSINGQTGKTCGELPVDDGKLKSLFFKVFIPMFAALLVAFYFL